MKKTIGTLTLISYTQGFDWEVYDEDGEFQGMFCGDINNTTEEEIWQGLGIPYHVVNIAAGDLGAPAAKKYDMEYCLLYGTLLGGIRHNGFIPWDDDCDILMMRSDYNKLIEILPKEISKHEFFKENLGCTLVATFGTETTKSAIQTACRGYRSEEHSEGIDVDEAQYLSSLVPSERGFLWPIHDVVYGNADKDRRPVTAFLATIKQYPGLLDIIMRIEGLINKRSSHASGVILFDEDPYEFGCFMKTPKGEITTQFDLHDCEYMGLTKYDFLVTEVQDKLVQAINLMQEDGAIEPELSLREVYDKYFHPNVLPIDDIKYWKPIQDVAVLGLFQFDSDVGAQAARKIKPSSILELADANGLMRLMTNEKGQETPMEKYVRYKNNINLWYREMTEYGLTKENSPIHPTAEGIRQP